MMTSPKLQKKFYASLKDPHCFETMLRLEATTLKNNGCTCNSYERESFENLSENLPENSNIGGGFLINVIDTKEFVSQAFE
jgi:hypothetical protein